MRSNTRISQTDKLSPERVLNPASPEFQTSSLISVLLNETVILSYQGLKTQKPWLECTQFEKSKSKLKFFVTLYGMQSHLNSSELIKRSSSKEHSCSISIDYALSTAMEYEMSSGSMLTANWSLFLKRTSLTMLRRWVNNVLLLTHFWEDVKRNGQTGTQARN